MTAGLVLLGRAASLKLNDESLQVMCQGWQMVSEVLEHNDQGGRLHPLQL